MEQKKKLVIGILVLVLIVVIAVVARNAFADRMDPFDIMLTEAAPDDEADEDSAADDDETDEDNISADGDEADEDSESADGETISASDFAMLDPDGNNVKLSDIIANGKPVVLNFWASWCPPCKSEMPDFEKVYKELGDEIQFMMVNLTDGQRETVEVGEKYIKDEGFTFPVFFDTDREGAIAYGISSIPTTFFIDSSGNIITGAIGAIDESALRRGIDMLS
jgi:thiol-disulfide isomerase/thioredoxin